VTNISTISSCRTIKNRWIKFIKYGICFLEPVDKIYKKFEAKRCRIASKILFLVTSPMKEDSFLCVPAPALIMFALMQVLSKL